MTDELRFQTLAAPGPVTVIRGGTIFACGERYLGVLWPGPLAEWICELLNTHGCLDLAQLDNGEGGMQWPWENPT